jgi:hypothetical protein
MLRLLNRIKATLEYLGGVTETPAVQSFGWLQGPIWWGVWWAALVLLILAFSGQASRFIYIDF